MLLRIVLQAHGTIDKMNNVSWILITTDIFVEKRQHN